MQRDRIMRALHSEHGVSLAETLIAVALVASSGAAVASGLATIAQLHRASEAQTMVVLAATSRLERLKSAVAVGLDPGGSIETNAEAWHAWLNREGQSVTEAQAMLLCRWAVTAGPAGAFVVAVRVEPRGEPAAAVTLSTVVRRE